MQRRLYRFLSFLFSFSFFYHHEGMMPHRPPRVSIVTAVRVCAASSHREPAELLVGHLSALRCRRRATDVVQQLQLRISLVTCVDATAALSLGTDGPRSRAGVARARPSVISADGLVSHPGVALRRASFRFSGLLRVRFPLMLGWTAAPSGGRCGCMHAPSGAALRRARRLGRGRLCCGRQPSLRPVCRAVPGLWLPF